MSNPSTTANGGDRVVVVTMTETDARLLLEAVRAWKPEADAYLHDLLDHATRAVESRERAK